MDLFVADAAPPLALLEQTLRRFVASEAQIATVTPDAIRAGMSGAAVRRYNIAYSADGAAPRLAQLVTKAATREEWRALQYLVAQRQPNVPFAHALDSAADGGVLICMQDVGATYRPTSLEPITDDALWREADGIAAIHAANLGARAALPWLPRMDRAYVRDRVLGRWWRPAWEAARADPAFERAFGAAIPAVEAAAARLLDDMELLLGDDSAHTLIHADLNPSNVLVHDGRPYFVDWQTAMYGPLYIDLPHHHCTLQQAEHYRVALAARGHAIPAAEFAARYRVAARYIGLRYMRWTLEQWAADHTETAWVEHYVGLITGAGLR